MKSIFYKIQTILLLIHLIKAITLYNTSLITQDNCDDENADSKSEYIFLIAGGYRVKSVLQLSKYMVSIRSRNPQKYFGDNHFCAGTIIGKQTVLTSAHCVMDKRRVLTRPRRLLLVAGTPNRLVATNATQQYPVESLTANTNFIRYNKDDIAIIRLKGEIADDNKNIKIMKMPTGPPDYGSNCTIIGWGRMLKRGPLAALPLHVNVTIFSPNLCKAFLHDYYYDGLICAGDSSNYDEDPCRGDSGGPLICNNTLTGIISWTIGCGSDRVPSLYTDVWYNRHWIDKMLNASGTQSTRNFIVLIIVIGFLKIFVK